jgi:hypothetical protein
MNYLQVLICNHSFKVNILRWSKWEVNHRIQYKFKTLFIIKLSSFQILIWTIIFKTAKSYSRLILKAYLNRLMRKRKMIILESRNINLLHPINRDITILSRCSPINQCYNKLSLMKNMSMHQLIILLSLINLCNWMTLAYKSVANKFISSLYNSTINNKLSTLLRFNSWFLKDKGLSRMNNIKRLLSNTAYNTLSLHS